MEEEIRKQYETETKKEWFTVPFTHGEQAFASLGYQLWLEKKVIQVEKRVSPKTADILYVIEMEGKDAVNIGRENLLKHLKFMTDNFNQYCGKAELFKYQKVEKIQ